jgi:hypothetical protein
MNEATNRLSAVAVDVRSTSVHGTRARGFFVGAAVVLLSIVFLGFAPTFYLRPFFAPYVRLRPVPWYRYVHGALMTLWYALFLIQASLVTGGRVRLHKRVGVATGLTAVAAIVMNLVTVLRGVHDGSVETGLGPREFVDRFHYEFVVLGDLVVLAFFAVFVSSALVLRTRPAVHGRLMYLASMSLLGPALTPARALGHYVSGVLPAWVNLQILVTIGLLFCLAAYDLRSTRRLHPVTVLGVFAFLILPLLTFPLLSGAAAKEWVIGLG